LLARLPARAQRARLVALDESVREPEVDSETVEARVLARDRDAAAGKANAVLRDALTALSTSDRVLLRLRFANSMRVSAIARAWQCDQQILYRRIDALTRRLRQQLTTAGIDAVTAAQLIGENDSRLDFGFTDSENTTTVQTISMEGDHGNEESLP